MSISLKNSPTTFLRITSLGFLTSIVLTINLWKPTRDFPLFPVFESLEALKFDTAVALWIVLAILAQLIFIQYKIQRSISVLILLIIILILFDQMRLQPWVYSFILLMLPFAITQDKASIGNYLKFLFAGVYIWSGIHKFNPYFSILIFESILVDGLGMTNVDLIISLKRFAIVVPIIEVTMGILLLFKKTQRIGAMLAISSHLFILYYVVFGLHGNFVIIPWNLVLISGLFFLFHQRKSIITFSQLPKFLSLVLIVVFLLPIGFLFGKVDQRVSFSMYDGKIRHLYFISQDNSLQNEHQKYLYENIIENGSILNFNALAYQELNVPFYAEDRFISRIMEKYPRNPNTQAILTRIPLWERNLKATYKSIEEVEAYYDTKSLPNITLKKSFYIPKFIKVILLEL